VTVTTGAVGPPSFTIAPVGPFSLAEAANFGFGQRAATAYDDVMRLAFVVDGYHTQVAVEVRQDAAGVHGWVQGEGDTNTIRTQVARVLSLDHDGNQFTVIGQRDPVIGRLQTVAPGLRPPLFYSPYEAAAWSVLSARRPATLMAEVRRRLSERHGRTFEVAGRRLEAWPTPEQLLEVLEFPGIPEIKLRRLHGIAAAAVEGRLDAGALRAVGVKQATVELRRLEGIGPFYAELIMIRGSGLADALPSDEPRLKQLVAELYGLAAPPSLDELATIAEVWRPLRTWAAVLIRAAAKRLEPTGRGLTGEPK
jgi:DNA-3-methyladenine glycosylase II